MAFDFPSSPTLGQTYQVTGGPTYVWNGTAWQVLTPGSRFNRQVYTATAGQTTFNATYLIGGVDVFHNGVKLAPADFTASNGSTVVLVSAANAGDTIEIVSYSQVNYTNAVQKTGDTMTGNLNFSGNALRITGDFSNATIANRLMFQTSTTNGSSIVNAIPNGTGTSAGFQVYNNSDPANAAGVRIQTSATESNIVSNVTGTGTFLPLTFSVGGSERVRIDTSGNVGIGTSSPGAKLNVVNNTNGGSLVKVDNSNSGASAYTGVNLNSDVASATFFTASSTAGTANAAFLRLDAGTGGLFLDTTPAAPIVFRTNSLTERMRIDSSGNVGIGTSSPSSYGNFVVYSAATNPTAAVVSGTANAYLRLSTTSDTQMYLTNTGGSMTMNTANTERMRIDSAGNVGIATSSPGAKLHVAGSIKSGTGVNSPNSQIMVNTVSGTAAGIQLYQDGNESWVIANPASSTALTFAASGNERARITNSGDVGIGLTSPGAKLDVKGAGNTSGAFAIKVANSDGTIGLQIRNDGYVGSPMIYANTNANAANVVVTSDGYIYRSTSSLKYKKNVQDAHYGLSELLALRPVTYQGKSGSDTDQVLGGLIAEEVHDAGLTEFVQYAEDGTPDALAYGNMVSLCIKAIQELSAKLDAAEARIAQLEGNN